MARRIRRRSARTRVITRTRVVTRKAKSIFSSPTLLGLAYGIARNPINNVTKQVTANLPFGNAIGAVGDELLLWSLATAGSMNSKGNRGLKNFFKTGQAVEAQNLGRQISLNGFSSMFSANKTATSTTQSTTNGGANF